MKAITIRQPWASLLVLGYKQYETRCWRTMYRGPLAIHAGKIPVKDTLAELMAQGREGRRIVEAVEMALEGHGGIDHIPHGAIIAVRNLVRCNVVDECFLSGLTNQEYMFGMTLTGGGMKAEPGAMPIFARLYQLGVAKEMGIKTWVSFDPVLDAHHVLCLIKNCNDIFNRVKIGKLNYHPSDIDWARFGRQAEDLCQRLGLDYTIKDSLRREMEAGT